MNRFHFLTLSLLLSFGAVQGGELTYGDETDIRSVNLVLSRELKANLDRQWGECVKSLNCDQLLERAAFSVRTAQFAFVAQYPDTRTCFESSYPNLFYRFSCGASGSSARVGLATKGLHQVTTFSYLWKKCTDAGLGAQCKTSDHWQLRTSVESFEARLSGVSGSRSKVHDSELCTLKAREHDLNSASLKFDLGTFGELKLDSKLGQLSEKGQAELDRFVDTVFVAEFSKWEVKRLAVQAIGVLSSVEDSLSEETLLEMLPVSRRVEFFSCARSYSIDSLLGFKVGQQLDRLSREANTDGANGSQCRGGSSSETIDARVNAHREALGQLDGLITLNDHCETESCREALVEAGTDRAREQILTAFPALIDGGFQTKLRALFAAKTSNSEINREIAQFLVTKVLGAIQEVCKNKFDLVVSLFSSGRGDELFGEFLSYVEKEKGGKHWRDLSCLIRASLVRTVRNQSKADEGLSFLISSAGLAAASLSGGASVLIGQSFALGFTGFEFNELREAHHRVLLNTGLVIGCATDIESLRLSELEESSIKRSLVIDALLTAAGMGTRLQPRMSTGVSEGLSEVGLARKFSAQVRLSRSLSSKIELLVDDPGVLDRARSLLADGASLGEVEGAVRDSKKWFELFKNEKRVLLSIAAKLKRSGFTKLDSVFEQMSGACHLKVTESKVGGQRTLSSAQNRGNANAYEVLGVSQNASQDEIKSAYRRLSRQWHPDLVDGSDAPMKELNVAYGKIRDSAIRKVYDQYLRGGFRPAPTRSEGAGAEIDELWEKFRTVYKNPPIKVAPAKPGFKVASRPTVSPEAQARASVQFVEKLQTSPFSCAEIWKKVLWGVGGIALFAEIGNEAYEALQLNSWCEILSQSPKTSKVRVELISGSKWIVKLKPGVCNYQ